MQHGTYDKLPKVGPMKQRRFRFFLVMAFCIDDATGELELIDTYPVEKGPKFLATLP